MPRSPRTPQARFHETPRQICDCPTGGQGRPPLQDVLRFRRKCVQFCDCIPPGRCGHRPLRGFCVIAVRLCGFVIAFRTGGAKPLPYVTTKRETAQSGRLLIPSVTAAPCHRLAAARSRRGSDSPPGCHSTPRRRFATLVTKGRLIALTPPLPLHREAALPPVW